MSVFLRIAVERFVVGVKGKNVGVPKTVASCLRDHRKLDANAALTDGRFTFACQVSEVLNDSRMFLKLANGRWVLADPQQL